LPGQRPFDEIAVKAAEQLRRRVTAKMKMSEVVHATSLHISQRNEDYRHEQSVSHAQPG
jgi:hypothetical protein